MTNNVTIDNGVNPDFTIATDDVGGVHYQYIKVAFGADDIATIVSSANPFPVAAISSPAAARNLDAVAVALQSDSINQGLVPHTPIFTAIAAATVGNNTIVAAAGASNKVQPHYVLLVATAAATVKFQSGAGGTDLTGTMSFAANGGTEMSFSPVGVMGPTAANTLLNMVIGGTGPVHGVMVHTVVQ